jgi:hypothetical protein
VLRLNTELLDNLAKAFAEGGVDAAWSAYDTLLGVRRDTYMQTDMQGDSGQDQARARRAARPAAGLAGATVGGYEGLALRVIDGLSGRGAGELIVNTRNGAGLGGTTPPDPPGRPHPPPTSPFPLPIPPSWPTSGRPSRPAPAAPPHTSRVTHSASRGGRPTLSLDFLDPDDIVEVPALVTPDGVSPRAVTGLPRSGQALVMQVKEYERGVVEAAMTGDAGLAAVALAQHPLVPGITAARELIDEYRAEHGEYLAYLR